MKCRSTFACMLMLLCLGVLGCSTGNEDQEPGNEERDARSGVAIIRNTVRYDSTDGEVLTSAVLIEGERLGRISGIARVGEYLIVEDGGIASAHVYGTDGSYLGNLGRRGQGPGEFESLWSVDIVSQDPPVIWAYDLNQLRMTRVNLDSLLSPEEHEPSTIKFQIGFTPTSPYVAGDSLVITPGFLPEPARLAYLNADDGTFVRTVGPAFSNPDDVPWGVLHHAYQSKMAVHPDGQKAALVYRYTDRVEILTLDGSLTHVARGPVVDGPTFDVGTMSGEPVMATKGGTLSAYSDVVCTDQRIYALYVGRYRNQPGSDFAATVHVFDWNGELVDILRLDRWTTAIGIDTSGTTLYTTSPYPEPMVLKYEIPQG